MFFPPSKQRVDRGFTLIEILTVITIIAVLAGLLLPVVGSVMTNARKVQASADERSIINAVASYQTEYSRLPLSLPVDGSDSDGSNGNVGFLTCYGDPGGRWPNYELFDMLRAIPEPGGFNDNNRLNPRKVVYFEAANVKNSTNPRSGILVTDWADGNNRGNGKYKIKAGSMVDPWGGEYIVYLDGSGSNDLTQAINWFYTRPSNEQGPNGPVQVSSLGPDNNFGKKGNQILTGSDDVITW